MKYIRTKEHGVCAVLKEDEHILHYHNSQVDGVLWKEDWKGRYKVADTIEELCDEFVYCQMLITEEGVKEIFNSKDYECKEIYGAIWTDKGLIYVAKMNDKGELELL